jgi:hypothetical protein
MDRTTALCKASKTLIYLFIFPAISQVDSGSKALLLVDGFTEAL